MLYEDFAKEATEETKEISSELEVRFRDKVTMCMLHERTLGSIIAHNKEYTQNTPRIHTEWYRIM